MNKSNVAFLRCFILIFAALFFFLPNAYALWGEEVTPGLTEGGVGTVVQESHPLPEEVLIKQIVEIERNLLYMLPVGSDLGLKKGETIGIYRSGKKVAEVRLISVLPDSSMGEVTGLIEITDIFESDTVRIPVKKEVPAVRTTLTTSEEEESASDITDVYTSKDEDQTKGMLGSESHVKEQVQEAKDPLVKEVKGLKQGITTLKEDYEGKMETVLNTVAGGESRAVLAAERKWKLKLEEIEANYQTQLAELRESLEKQFQGEREALESRIQSLTRQMAEAGETGDVRTKQLLTDLKGSDVSIKTLKESFEAERRIADKQWQEKMTALEERYDNQLRIERDDFERELRLNKDTFQSKLSEFESQLIVFRENSDKEITQLRSQLKEQRGFIDLLKKEKGDLELNMTDKNRQLVKYKKEHTAIQDELNTSKATYAQKMDGVKRPLENEIEDLKKKLEQVQQESSKQLKDTQNNYQFELQTMEEQWNAKFAAATSQSKNETDTLRASLTDQTAQWQAQLAEAQGKAAKFEQTSMENEAIIQNQGKLLREYKLNIKDLEEKLNETETSREATIQAAKASLEQELEKLRNKMVEVVDGYEGKLGELKTNSQFELSAAEKGWSEQKAALEKKAGEDASLIEFLNGEMSSLTNDVEERNQKIAKLEEEVAFLKSGMDSMVASNQTIQEKAQSDLMAAEVQWQERMKAETVKREEALAAVNQEAAAQVSAIQAAMDQLKGEKESQVGGMEAKLQEKEGAIKSLEEKLAKLGDNVKSKDDQISKYENDIARLRDTLADTKLSQSRKVEKAAKPLNGKIEKLSRDLVQTERKYESQISELLRKAQSDLLENERQWQAKLDAEKKNYQTEYAALRQGAEKQVNDLQAKITTLENANAQIAADVQRKDGQLTEFEDSIVQLKEKLTNTTLSSTEKLELTKKPLNEKILNLSQELAAVRANYERQAAAHEQKLRDTEKGAQETVLVSEKKWEAKLLEAQDKYQKQINDRDILAQKQRDEVEGQYKDQIASLNDQLQKEQGKGDARVKALEGDLFELRRASTEFAATKTDFELSLKDRDKEIAALKESKKQLEDKLAEVVNTRDQRAALAKDSMTAEIGVLKSELALAKEQYEGQISQMREKSAEDLRATEEKWQAKLNASEAQWKVKLVEREEEHEMKRIEESKDLQQRLSSNKDELRDTVIKLNNQLRMLKDSSDSQIKELEAELSSQQYTVALNDSEAQRNLAKVEEMWAKKLEEQQKKHEEELQQHNQNLGESFLGEKRELRETVIDLTNKFRDLRDSSMQRIKELEAELEKRDFKLNLAEHSSREDLIGVEDQWQAKLIAAEERHQMELKEQEQQLEGKYLTDRQKLEQTVEELNKQLSKLRASSQLGVDLKAEELASELVMAEGKHQKELSDLKDESSAKLRELMEKVRYQQARIDSLERGKPDVTYNIEAENKWRERMTAAERRHQQELLEQERRLESQFMAGRQKMDQIVDELNRQIGDLKAQAQASEDLKGGRLASELERAERKHQDELSALKASHDNEWLERERKLESQYLSERQDMEQKIDDLNKQVAMLQTHSQANIELKDEELAAERAKAERKYQQELSTLQEGNSAKIRDLEEKVKYQQNIMDTLEREKSNVAYDASRVEQELARYQSEVGELKKESKMMELSQSEKINLTKQSALSKIEELNTQLAVAKQKAMQEQMDLEERWRSRLSSKDAEYLEKLKLQRQQMENEMLELKNKLSLSADDREEKLKELKQELEDNQSLIQALTQEKFSMSADLDEKGREIVRLNEEIIGLKEALDAQKDMASVSTLTSLAGRALEKRYDEGKVDDASKDSLDTDFNDSKEYFAVIRKAILSRFREFDFSDYAGKVDVVKIDFELLANGSPKGTPKFLGTDDEKLIALLNRCFKDAMPFPPFPENLKKESQRFALSISFKK